jgi:hypothetical protein
MRRAGAAGLTVERFGDSEPWVPRTTNEKNYSEEEAMRPVGSRESSK